jgi:hypothetical protein
MWSGRRSYYRDSYGRWHEDRDAGRGRGFRGKWGLISLLVLAAIIVLASLMQSAYHAVVPSPQAPHQISSSASASSKSGSDPKDHVP